MKRFARVTALVVVAAFAMACGASSSEPPPEAPAPAPIAIDEPSPAAATSPEPVEVAEPTSGPRVPPPSEPAAPVAIQALPPVLELPGYGTTVLLDPSSPPSSLPVVRFQNERRIVGSESPSITPARDLEIVEGAQTPAFEAMLVSCPSAHVDAVRALWVRDHLGEDVWRAAVVIHTDANVYTTTPCAGGPWFHAASPAAIVLGAHTASVLELSVVPAGRDGTGGGFASSRFTGQLVSSSEGGHRHIDYRSPDGSTAPVMDEHARMTEVAYASHQIVPYALCFEGRATLLDAHCAPAQLLCTYRLLSFAACE